MLRTHLEKKENAKRKKKGAIEVGVSAATSVPLRADTGLVDVYGEVFDSYSLISSGVRWRIGASCSFQLYKSGFAAQPAFPLRRHAPFLARGFPFRFFCFATWWSRCLYLRLIPASGLDTCNLRTKNSPIPIAGDRVCYDYGTCQAKDIRFSWANIVFNHSGHDDNMLLNICQGKRIKVILEVFSCVSI